VKLKKEGAQTVMIDAWDALGNHAIIQWVIYYDTTPPLMNITSPANGLFTNQSSVSITGNTEKNATATINDRPVTVDASGYFSTSIPLDKEGRNDITITITDPAGNRARTILNITKDTQVHLDISSPRDGQKTSKKNITLIGTAEPNSTVTVQGNAAHVQPDGSFFTEVALNEGKNVITVTMKDAAGNTKTTVVTVERTKTASKGNFIPGLGTVGILAALGMLIFLRWRK